MTRTGKQAGFLAFALVVGGLAAANISPTTPTKPADEKIDPDPTWVHGRWAQSLIVDAGYRCDRVNKVWTPNVFRGGYRVDCEPRYKFTIYDRGGKFTVEAD